MFKTIGIIGLGMIGGSVARDIKRLELADRVIAYDRDNHALQLALNNKWIDQIASSVTDLAATADLIILALPCQSYGKIFTQIAQVADSNALITDVGSIKQQLIDECKQHTPSLLKRYLPAHPLAGSDKSGVENAQEKLFEKAIVITTPTEHISTQSENIIANFWLRISKILAPMSAQQHDYIVSITSHLPHLLSFTFLDAFISNGLEQEIFSYTAGGFKDFTRLAASNITIWSDIFRGNRQNLKEAISAFKLSLNKIEEQLDDPDNTKLIATLEKARTLKLKHHTN